MSSIARSETAGLAVDQTEFDYRLDTMDCNSIDFGSSRCGHEYGITLSADEKQKFLE